MKKKSGRRLPRRVTRTPDKTLPRGFLSMIRHAFAPPGAGGRADCLRFAAPAEATHVREVREVFRPKTSRNQVSQIWEGHKKILQIEIYRLVPFSAQTDITKVNFHRFKV